MASDALYTEVILYHNKSQHNKRLVQPATAIERGHNPNCGDDLTLTLRVTDGLVEDAGYTGSGCAISQASMSIMIDLIKGKPVEEAKRLSSIYFRMIRAGVGHAESSGAAVGELTHEELELLEDAALFESLGKMPARVKCGTLGWHCLEVCLENKE